ncbi:MAG: GAF domain-containing protein [Anaerolineaceae bacterium]|nr:GAF domain-containing protein [Anaerolineaceae bacterium]
MINEIERQANNVEEQLWNVFLHAADIPNAIVECLSIVKNYLEIKSISIISKRNQQYEFFFVDELSQIEKQNIIDNINGKMGGEDIICFEEMQNDSVIYYECLPFNIAKEENSWLMIVDDDKSKFDNTLISDRFLIFFERVLRVNNVSNGMVQHNYMSTILDNVFSESKIRIGLEEIQLRLVSEIKNAFSCEAGTIAFIDYNSGGLILKKSLIESPEWVCSVSAEPGEGLLGQCINQNSPIMVNDCQINKVFREEVDGIPGLKTQSLLYVPISIGDIVIGALGLHNKKHFHFLLKDKDLFASISKTIAIYLFYLQIIQQLQVQNADLEAKNWELINSRNTLRILFDNIPDSVYIIDRKYRLNAINMSRSERAAKEPRHIVGKLCYEALFARDTVCPGCLVGKTIFKKEITHRINREWDEQGEQTEWTIDAYPIFDDENEVVKVILFEKDVTEKNRLETIIAQSEKLAAVGQLAAGIAHEINNPLTVILANAQLLQRDMADANEEWLESIDLVYKAGSRALYVVRNLLDFARKEKYDFVPTNINGTIERAVEMVQHELIQRSVQLKFDADENLPDVMASADHLHGLWLNLIINAIDASDSNQLPNRSGIIDISTTHDDKHVKVRIADNGQGMTSDKLKRIFEPFYTTKEPNKGTGLGLSVSHRVIRQHGGDVQVDSEPDVGTAFLISLPIYR